MINSPISVVIITYNEEINIARCINSVKSIADEIIVVDSFSTDKTETICKELGVSFYQNKFEGYAEQKNFANSLTKNKIILSMDADEALSEELTASIKTLNVDFNTSVVSFNRLTNYCGKWIRHCGWYPDTKIRIFNKDYVKWGGGKVHEKLVFEFNLKQVKIKGDLLHYSYYSIDQHKTQALKYAQLGAEELMSRNKIPTNYHLYLKPIVRFLQDYIWKLGILDGYYGFIICTISAKAIYQKYSHLRELYINPL